MDPWAAGLLFGGGFALVVSVVAWLLGPGRGLPLLAILLGAAAAVYLGASWAEPRATTGSATIAFIGFAGLALWGWERAWILAVGWLGHTLWDLLHLTGGLFSSAPEWYVVACLVADPLLAGFLIWWGVGKKARSPTAFAPRRDVGG